MLRRIGSTAFEAAPGARIQLVVEAYENDGVNDARFRYGDRDLDRESILGLPGCSITVSEVSERLTVVVLFSSAARSSARYHLFEVEHGVKSDLGVSITASASTAALTIHPIETAAGEVRWPRRGRVIRRGTKKTVKTRKTPELKGIFKRIKPESTRATRAPSEFDRYDYDVAGPELEIPLDAAPVRPSSERHVQVAFFEARPEPLSTVPPALTVDLGIRIARPASESWTTADVALDTSQLPPSSTGHDLMVGVVELRDGAREPLNAPAMGALHLPLEGPTATVRFRIRLPDAGCFVARVIVCHRMRVLQTLVLTARVGTEDIRLRQENIVRPTLAALGNRSEFDAALVVNDHPDGTPGLIPITPKTIGFHEPADLATAVRDLERSIQKLTTLAETAVNFRSRAVKLILVDIACQGKQLWDMVADRLDPLFRNAHRIQVVEARRGAFFPIELLYPLYAPNDNARVCEEGLIALTKNKRHDCRHKLDRAWVCPASFWGFTRVIERRAHTDIEHGYAYAVSEPTADRTRLEPLRSVVVGASDRVRRGDLDGKDGVLQTLRRLSKTVYRVANWRAWPKAIEQRAPTLLVLFPHTVERGGPRLEIGREELLAARIEMDYVRRAADLPGPVVLLLGCNVKLTRIAFQSCVERFRDKGASLVLGTIAPIRGRHATRFTGKLFAALRQYEGSGAAFGDALLTVKQTMLAAGEPFALALMAYGDADWQL